MFFRYNNFEPKNDILYLELIHVPTIKQIKYFLLALLSITYFFKEYVEMLLVWQWRNGFEFRDWGCGGHKSLRLIKLSIYFKWKIVSNDFLINPRKTFWRW